MVTEKGEPQLWAKLDDPAPKKSHEITDGMCPECGKKLLKKSGVNE